MSEEAIPVLVPPGVMGYTDRISYRPGGEVHLHVSTEASRWTGHLVRLFALDIPSAGVERRETPVDGVSSVEAEGIAQRTPSGSYAVSNGLPSHSPGLTIDLRMMPTRPQDGRQGVLSRAAGVLPVDDSVGPPTQGWALSIDEDSRMELVIATEGGPVRLVNPAALVDGTWYRATAVIPDGAGEASLRIEPVGTFEANRVAPARGPALRVRADLAEAPLWAEAPLLWGCGLLEDGVHPHAGFDGRLEDPLLIGDALAESEAVERAALLAHPALLAHYSLAEGIGAAGIARASRIADLGPHGAHAMTGNHPTRAVTGSTWSGDTMDFRYAPEQYAAIHFHRSDMTDCRWVPQASIVLPDDLPSGVYAVMLRDSNGAEDRVPVIVAPAEEGDRAPILLVLPSNSYLAYANDHVGVDSPRTQVWSQIVPTLDRFELFRNAQRELGLSLYEVHSDGQGVCFSSWRRPILTMRERVYDHNAPVWQFTGDMQLVDWFDRTGRRIDVVTDREVHEQGAALLGRYRLVVTGTHPEYPSREILQAYEDHVATGGRLIYTGGNGMYWVTGYDPEDEQVVEIRRWGATQAWIAQPGEYHLSTTGQQGGIWRFRGRPPQKTFGVGFVAAGNPASGAGYRRTTRGAGADWVFSGVEVDDFGQEGVSGGAAGIEIDSVNPIFGTPAETVVLATSLGHNDDMLEARENFNMTSRVLGGGRNPKVHSDLVIVPREQDGAVFSTGSIAFAGALRTEAGGESAVSRLFGNVVDRFLEDGPVLDADTSGDVLH